MASQLSTCETVLAVLRAHRAELEELGLRHLGVFGSARRGEATPQSDVDLLAEFAEPVVLFRFLDVKERLEAILARPVDLVTRPALKRQLRERILEEMAYAF